MGRTLLNLSEEMKKMRVVKMKKTLHNLMVNITSHNLCHFFFYINILTLRGKPARKVPEGWKHRLKDYIKIRLEIKLNSFKILPNSKILTVIDKPVGLVTAEI